MFSAIKCLSFNFNLYVIRSFLLSSVGFVQGSLGGATFAFTSILFTQLPYDNSIKLNSDQESWIASITTLLMFPSCFLNTFLLEMTGRKRMLIFSEMLNIIGWVLILFATNYSMIFYGRLVLGIYCGSIYPTFITFLGEVVMPQYRSVLITALPFGSTFGTLACQLLGEYVHWKVIAAIFAFASLYNIAVSLYMAESYVTYLDRNKLKEADEIFQWYRGSSSEAQQEFKEILEDKRNKSKDSIKHVLELCMTRSFLVPFGITTLVFLTNEVTATQAIIFYTSDVIKMIKDDATFQYYATLSLNILRIVAVILSSILTQMTSVRFILISSGFALGVSLISLGVFMYLSVIYVHETVFPIISLILLILCAVLYGIGLGPLPSVVCGEMFPQSTRSIGGSGCAALSFLFLFIVVKFLPIMFDTVGAHITFAIFGVCTLVGITISHFVLPNTKNKTLQEINKLYQSKKYSSS